MSPKYKLIPDKDYVLWQMPCSGGETSMGYVINAADGRNFVIDGGRSSDSKLLLELLRDKCGGDITAWFVTHPHPGHAGALCDILDDIPSDIKISKIFYCHLSRDAVERLEPQSLNFVLRCNAAIKGSGIPSVSVSAGDRLKFGRTMIRVFSAGEDAEYTENYVDNTGVVYKFNMFCTSILFLGDIRREASIAILEKYKNELNCDIIQMANHGIHGALSEIYAMATPDICLWSSPEKYLVRDTEEGELFTEEMNLLEALGAGEHYISGRDGLARISIVY